LGLVKKLDMQKRVFIIFLVGIHFILNGQTNVAPTISNTLPFENVNLVTDRDLYLSGESIWFRADISIDNNLKELSKILYIELFNADQKSIVRKKYRIDQGKAQGVLDIPSEFLSGNYYLRAYTHYLKNFPVDRYFLGAIQIINPKIGLSAISDKSEEPTIYQNKTYLESGISSTNISITLPKKPLIKSTKAFLCANGTIHHEIIFLKNGWGTIDFHDIDSINYSLVFKNASNDSLSKDIISNPSPFYSIKATKSDNGQQVISIHQANSLNKNNSAPFSLELTNSKLQVLSSAQFILSNKQTQVILPNSEISSSGLYYYILKEKNKKILKIKAFIFSGNSNFSLKIPVLNIYKKRQEANLQLNNFNTSNISNIGFKVILKGTVQAATAKLNLYFNDPRLLFSYLKNQFNPEELSSQEEDVFLNILNSKLNSNEFMSLFHKPKSNELIYLPEVRDIGLSGIVVNKLTQKPMANVPVYLSVFREHPQIHIYKSRDDGSFFFSLNNFEKEQNVFLCPLFENEDELELKINRDFNPIFPILKPIPLTINSTYNDLLEQMLVASQTARAYKLSAKNQDYSISHLPYSFENPQASIVLDDYIETPTMEMVFKELVPGVHVKKRKDNFNLSVFDSERELFYNDPLILVDEVPVFDVNELMKISPSAIEKIELHKTPFILGDHSINGIIMIRTLTDNFGGMIMPISSTFFEYQTLSPSYNFLPKTYQSVEEKKSRTADFRTLLLWEPFIKNNNITQLNFFTSDIVGEYEAYIFGTNHNGQSIRLKLLNIEVVD
jgi:hypothetical protein